MILRHMIKRQEVIQFWGVTTEFCSRNSSIRISVGGALDKYVGKRCPPNQLKIKLITRNSKNLRLHFLQVTKFVSQIIVIL